MNFFDTLSDKREVAFRELDETKFVPAIRNHLVQLFRKAHAAIFTIKDKPTKKWAHACIWRSEWKGY